MSKIRRLINAAPDSDPLAKSAGKLFDSVISYKSAKERFAEAVKDQAKGEISIEELKRIYTIMIDSWADVIEAVK